MNRWSALALLLAVAGGLALRAPGLDTRPFHNDEAVNAIKVTELWQRGSYAYDPDEYHGPTLHYATLPFLWLSGARNSDQLTDTTLRLAPVAFGVGLILLLLLFTDGLGRNAVIWAAVFTAISPGMVFYSRYFIHEMLLVFFTMLTLGAGWRYAQTGFARWAVVAGLGVGLMFATKETFVITIGAMVLAGIATTWGNQGALPQHPGGGATPACLRFGRTFSLPWRHLGLGIAAALLVWLLFFSSFFTNFRGIPDSIRTYLPWLKRAGGHSPHIHPWTFYLERLAWFHPTKGPAWSEGLILVLATVGALVSLRGKKTSLHRFLVFYTVILLAAYSAILYKTPWCMLSFLHGLILLAGIGAAALISFFTQRVLKVFALVIIAALALQLGWQAWRASFVFASDRRNPYVYAQTVPDVLNLVRRAEGIARVAPAGYKTLVKVVAQGGDYWPLPWYLRRFQQVGWYDQLPADPFAPIAIVSWKLQAALDEKSDKKWIMAGGFEMRPGQFFELYVDLELWKKYVETLPRVRED